jgi:excisionase family DNA binding protein
MSVSDKAKPSTAGLNDSITASQAAAILNVSSDSIRRWHKLGLLPAYRVGPGSRLRINPADLNGLATRRRP